MHWVWLIHLHLLLVCDKPRSVPLPMFRHKNLDADLHICGVKWNSIRLGPIRSKTEPTQILPFFVVLYELYASHLFVISAIGNCKCTKSKLESCLLFQSDRLAVVIPTQMFNTFISHGRSENIVVAIKIGRIFELIDRTVRIDVNRFIPSRCTATRAARCGRFCRPQNEILLTRDARQCQWSGVCHTGWPSNPLLMAHRNICHRINVSFDFLHGMCAGKFQLNRAADLLIENVQCECCIQSLDVLVVNDATIFNYIADNQFVLQRQTHCAQFRCARVRLIRMNPAAQRLPAHRYRRQFKYFFFQIANGRLVR